MLLVLSTAAPLESRISQTVHTDSPTLTSFTTVLVNAVSNLPHYRKLGDKPELTFFRQLCSFWLVLFQNLRRCVLLSSICEYFCLLVCFGSCLRIFSTYNNSGGWGPEKETVEEEKEKV